MLPAATYTRSVLVTLAFFAGVAAIIAAVGGTTAWLTSPPPAHHRGAIATLRRTLAARTATARVFCRNCQEVPADNSGYCSTACAEHDAAMQAIA